MYIVQATPTESKTKMKIVLFSYNHVGTMLVIIETLLAQYIPQCAKCGISVYDMLDLDIIIQCIFQ